ncbi:MarR family winged helix-turn-helix transcriptional regulator [Marinobacter sp. X15-166B]|uniref:MarR family winged helix-turn-helix transcriptional regulator n=1 Tax=Marinobacter sp. X15-166B TaxID=1897620 RepID=UPI00085C6DAA|nr:MarR family winged helix-turn-helix transcriptional regulator [Marinobacter sp. X15-166B]OEY67290.1 MarR family transcriptional regulator [Marinobacter sp. X15-166B]
MNARQLQQLLERLSSLLHSENRARLNRLGLQPVQFEALQYLSLCNRYSNTPKAVAEYLGLTKGTVSQSIKVLENRGLVTKSQDTEDKRITRLQTTAMGRELVESLTPSPLLADYCNHAPPGEPEALVTQLTSLLRQVQALHQHRMFGQCHSCRHNRKLGEGRYLCQLTGESLSAPEVQLICREHEPVADS